MKMLVIVPRIVKNYIASFPETSQNAYKYFNYDHRVVEERVFRGDKESTYRGPNQFNNSDYDALVVYAKTLVNPILNKYSRKVANEDALSMAIRSFNNGFYDGKINANSFNALIDSMDQEPLMGDHPEIFSPTPVQAKKDKPIAKKPAKKPETKAIPPRILRDLGINQQKLKLKDQVVNKRVPKGVPHFVRKPGKGVVIEK